MVPGLGRKGPAGRVFGVHPALDRVAACGDVGLHEVELIAECDTKLQGDEVETGHELGHGMFDLESGVHLQEVERAVFVEELHGSGALVVARLTETDRRFTHLLADLVGETPQRESLRRVFGVGAGSSSPARRAR